jgi:hypothetical protein
MYTNSEQLRNFWDVAHPLPVIRADLAKIFGKTGKRTCRVDGFAPSSPALVCGHSPSLFPGGYNLRIENRFVARARMNRFWRSSAKSASS